MLIYQLYGFILSGESMETWVYFIQCKNGGAIKIGVAKDVDARLRDLQCSNPYQLYEISRFPFESRKQAYGFENFLHRKFKRWRIRGEWFKPVILKKLQVLNYKFQSDEIDYRFQNHWDSILKE